MDNNDPSRGMDPVRSLFEAHPRGFLSNRYVYPVLSRRAGGISIGVNLSRDMTCNFDCVYCQVNRAESGETGCVEVDRLSDELISTVKMVLSGQIYLHEKFCHTPPGLRRLNDIAISGDGEPTLNRHFDEVVQRCVDVRRRFALDAVKIVLITNASMFHRPNVRRGLEILDSGGGEIWAKLDCGTEPCFRRIARSAVTFGQILENLLDAARVRPLVIQSLWFRWDNQPPSFDEQKAYCDRLRYLIDAGGQIKLVQIHTVARPAADSRVSALSDEEMEALADRVRLSTGLPIVTFLASQFASTQFGDSQPDS